MAHKYGILVYEYISQYQGDFDVISLPWDAVQVWPTADPIKVTDKNGQVQYQWPLTVFFKIVEDADWGTDQDDAINQAVTDWNANPDHANRQIPGSLQLIYTYEEAPTIPQVFEDERQRLIANLPY